ncbi:response regulator transcription factor [Phycicoccus endophyticus]|uniref:Response regulator transcription factor n=1 Tax=Phycicoccus endophyticus TaxID=1690220 RepID=A0A7G9R4X7_9MICO|nr:response regulator transcription factor [Phycicoccus endophyticus]NHI18585.1 response regulator transcription factor [Phycicoccus endophyticus]QNN50652.1 response regulator transcription factor [Phycicoccus endophyticus]GGL22652.1 DNA-binding response regulator [Phycicoccus endophyticus]
MTGEEPGPAAAVPPRVLVADDHPLWLAALERDLVSRGVAVVGTASDGPSAVRRTRAVRPDVLVLDLNLPGMRGDEVCRALGDLPTRVLILSASGEQQDVLAAIKAGATGYLVKSAAPEEILEAVLATGRGEAVFTPGLAGLVLGEYRRMGAAQGAQGRPEGDGPIPALTPRETEILRLVATGMSSKEIAAQLVVSHRTVQNHVQNTLGKLHLHNRVELVRFALAHGLEDEDPA